MHTKKLISVFSFLTIAGSASQNVFSAIPDKKPSTPNIVVILGDDMCWDMPGFNGGKRVDTKNLNKLAAEGVKLTQFYSQSVCSPTRACLMTGRYPFRTGMEERPHGNDTHGMLTDERTIAQAMKEAGYYTAILGKWHLGEWRKEHLPMQRGFDYQYGHYGALIDYFHHDRTDVLDWHRNEQPLIEEGYSTFLIADEFEKMLKKRDSSKPFFVYVPFNAVHSPHQAPEEFMKKYNNDVLDAMLDCMDIAIGRILISLEKEGLMQNTLVVFFNDNGGVRRCPCANLPYRGLKESFYEGGIRVPCVLKWTGVITPGTSVDEPVHVVDLYPTLINIAKGSLVQPLPLDGKDIWQTITNNATSPHTEIIHSLKLDILSQPGAIRVGDFKLVGDELYNIKLDPYETANIAIQYPEKVNEMKARLDELAKERRPRDKGEKIPGWPLKVKGEEENRDWKGLK